jgi:hypothetical protein
MLFKIFLTQNYLQNLCQLSTENMTQHLVCSEYLSQKNVKTADYSKVELVFTEYF